MKNIMKEHSKRGVSILDTDCLVLDLINKHIDLSLLNLKASFE